MKGSENNLLEILQLKPYEMSIMHLETIHELFQQTSNLCPFSLFNGGF